VATISLNQAWATLAEPIDKNKEYERALRVVRDSYFEIEQELFRLKKDGKNEVTSRKKSIRDDIRANRRQNHPHEAKFYSEWMREHASRIGKSYTTLEYLLAENPNYPAGECTERDEYVAEVLIQWLGSPVGLSFLRNCGFEEEE